MANTLPPVVIELQLQVDQMQQQLKAVTSQLGHVGKAAKESTGPMGHLGESFKEVGRLAVAAFAGVEIVKFLSESAHAASANAESLKLMEVAMRNSMGASKEQVKTADAQLERLSAMSGVMTTELRPGFSNLIRATHDSSKALALQKLALDVSAGTGKEVSVVSMALSKAYMGNVNALNKIVPGAKNAKDAFQFLQQSFKGAAEEAAKTDPFSRMAAAMEQIKVALGNALLPLFQTFADVLVRLKPVFDALGEVFSKVVDAAMPLVERVLNALLPLLNPIVDLFGALVEAVTPLIEAILPPLTDLLNMIAPYIQDIVEALLPWIKLFGGILKVAAPLLAMLLELLNLILKPLIQVAMAFSKMFTDHLTKALDDAKPALDAVSGALQTAGLWLKSLLDPLGKAVDGFLKLIGLQGKAESNAAKDAALAREKGAENWQVAPSLPKGSGGGGGGGGSTVKSGAQQLREALAAFRQGVLVAQKKYQADSESLLADHTKKIADITASGKAQIEDIYKQQQQLTIDHNKRVQDITANGMKKIADVVAASKALLTDAFRNATKVDTASMFVNAGANIGNFMSMLKDKLSGAKKLADDAAKLAGLGYSQEFIDSIVAQGPYVGDALAQQLIAAGPEQATALQAQINELNQVSNHGVDTLADQINQNGNLATEDLRNQYVTAQQDLVNALKDENDAYAASAQALNDKMVKAQQDLADALKKENDEYAASALKMLRAYEVAMAKLQIARDRAAIKALEVGGVTAAERRQIAAYNRDIAAENAIVAAGGTTVNVVANTNASPDDVARSVVNAIKFNAPVSVGA